MWLRMEGHDLNSFTPKEHRQLQHLWANGVLGWPAQHNLIMAITELVRVSLMTGFATNKEAANQVGKRIQSYTEAHTYNRPLSKHEQLQLVRRRIREEQ